MVLRNAPGGGLHAAPDDSSPKGGSDAARRVDTQRMGEHQALSTTLQAPSTEEAGSNGPSGPIDAALSYPQPAPRTGLLTDQQLQRLEAQLVAEAGGDPDREREVRFHLAHARARFASATIRQFLPILIERAVRQRMAQS